MFGLIALLVTIFIGVWIFWGFGDTTPNSAAERQQTYDQALDMAGDAAKKFEEQKAKLDKSEN